MKKLKLFALLLFVPSIFALASCNMNDAGAVEHTIESPITQKYFPSIYKEGFFTASDDTLSLLDEYALQMREFIVNTDSKYTPGKGGTVYYFSENGNDANDGLSPETAKKTLAELEYDIELKAGDVVLFERGSMFRGVIKARSGVTYSAYAEGEKPVICASKKNYADAGLWEETEYENVYVCTNRIENAGNIVFNNTWTLGDYEQLLGNMKIPGVDDFNGPADLGSDLDFYSDIRSGKLYLYSEQGNPSERFNSIEIAEGSNIIDVSNVKDVTIDNLHFTLGGAHGVGATNADNLIVRNCIFNWIGGSILQKTTRYGNAVESYIGCDGFYVYNNWIYQMYDTGVTAQYSLDPGNKHNEIKNIEFSYNLIEYCYWSFEYYNKTAEGLERITENIYVHDNFCRMGGEGWGRGGAGHMCCFTPSGETIRNIRIEDNIFDRGHAFLVSTYNADASQLEFNGNIYVQEDNHIVARILGENHKMNSEALSLFTDLIGDKKACVICVPEE